MRMNNLRQNKVISIIAVFTFFVLQSNLIYAQAVIENALPQGANVVAGSASIDTSGNTMNITTSDRPIVQWNSFNIGQTNTVNFIQPASSSVALNRVVGVDPSSIYGALNANGHVFIVNPNGVFFGPGSRVDVNGLVASTLDINNADFLAGRYNFFKNGGNGSVTNEGSIIANGGYVALLSNAVSNSGSIIANLGKVVLAAGERMTVALDDASDISVTIDDAVQNNVFGADGQKIKDAVSNTGTVQADGGKIVLNAKVLNGIFDNAVNNSGVIAANSLVNHNGVIELKADGGNITASTASLTSAKAKDATAQGGTVDIYSNMNTIIENLATIDVSGGSVSGDAGFADISALGNVDFAGILNGYAADGYKLGEAIIDPPTATVSGAFATNTTFWATGDITITGATTIASGFTLNIFADHTSATAGTWDNGTGTITRSGNFTISALVAGSGILNLKAGSGIGTSGSPIQVSGLSSLSIEMNPTAGSGGAFISNSGATSLTVSSATTRNGDINLSSASSSIILAGTVNTGTAIVTLNPSSGGANQTGGSLTAGSLLLSGTGTYTLNQASNNVGTLAANVNGTISYTDTNALTVGTVGATNGITTSNDAVTLNTGNTLTLTKNIDVGSATLTLNPTAGGVTATLGSVTAGNLLLTGVGTYTLDNANNDVGTLAANVNGAISYNDTNTLTVGTVGATNGITTSNDAVTLNTDSALTLSKDINIGSATLTLNPSAGGVNQTAGKIVASNLLLTGVGTNTLTSSTNDVGTIAANVNGDTSYTDANTLTVGTVGATNGITTSNDDVTLNTGGTLTLSKDINIGSGIITLNPSAGGINQTAGKLVATNLLLTGAGTYTLTSSTNDVGTIAANINGDTSYTDANALTVGTVSGTNGITTSNDAVTLNTGGTLTLSKDINAGTNTITLNPSAGGINQTAGKLIAANLLLTGVGTNTLDSSTNDVGTLAANVNGTLTYTDANALIVGSVGVTDGITTSNDAVTLNTGNTLTLSKDINIGSATLTLNPTVGGINQTAGKIVASNLLLTGVGTNTLTSSTNDVGTLAADINGTLTYTDTNALTVGTVSGTDGITTSNDAVTLNTGNTLTLSKNIDIGSATLTLNPSAGGVTAALGSVTAGNLLLTGVGTYALTNVNNDVGTLAANVNGALNYTDTNALTVGSVGVTDGITTSNDAVTLNTGGTLTLSKDINIGNAILTLNPSTGGVNQTAGKIIASNLLLTGVGTHTLTSSTNDVGTLAANINGTLTYTDTNALTVGTVSGTDGITTSNDAVTLNTGSTLTLAKNINVGSATLTLNPTAGGVTATAGSVTAGNLLLTGIGTYILNNANNDVGTLAAAITGALTYTDLNALTVDTVGVTNGITTGGNNVTLNTGDLLTLNKNITASGAIVTLNSAGGVDPVGAVIADSLLLTGTGTFELLGANDVGTLAANVNGTLTYTDINALTVGTVSGTDGITTSNDDVTLNTGNTLTLSKDINIGSAVLTLNPSSGGINQTAGKVVATNLLLTGVGTNTLTSSTNDVGTLAADINGTLAYTDTNALTVGTVSGTDGITTSNDAVTLNTGNTLTLSKNIDIGSATLTLNPSAGGINQTAGKIIASNLLLTGVGTNILDSSTNDVGTIAANINGSLTYTDTNALTVGTVGIDGITTSDDAVTLNTGGTLTLSKDINIGNAVLTLNPSAGGINQTAGKIIASNLLLTGVGINTLTSSTNDVDTLAADVGGALTYTDADDLAVGTVGTTNGITTSNDAVTLNTGSTLTLTKNIDVGSATLTLNPTAGGVTATAGSVTAGNLLLTGAGTYTLTNANNDVDTLAANVNGAVSYHDTNTLTVGTVGATNGITSSGNAVTLTTDGKLTLSKDINAGANTIILDAASGGVDQTAGKLLAANLLLSGVGTHTLTSLTNDVDTLAADINGTLTYTDADGLSVGTVGTTDGITTSNDDVTLNTTGLLTIDQNISVGSGTVILNSAGGVDPVGAILASELLLTGTGTFDLSGANDVGTLAADINGSLSYNDINTLTVGTVSGTSGITTSNDDVTLNTGSTLTLSENIDVGSATLTLNPTAGGVTATAASVTAGKLLLTGAGTYTLTNSSNDVGTIAANINGPLTYTDTNILTVGTVGIDGITTSNDAVTLNTGGTLTLSKDINIGNAVLTLNPSAGGINQTAGKIIASNLLLTGVGTHTLTSSTNDVGTLAADINGTLTYTDANALAIGTVSGTDGITTSNDAVTLNTGGTLTLTKDIDVSNATLTLNPSAGGVNQTTGKLLATNLLLTGAGTYTLNNANNDVDTLAANVDGPLSYNDTNTLTVGSVGGTDGITSNSNAVTLTTDGKLTLTKDIDAGTNTITLDAASGGISQTAGKLLAANLLLSGAGTNSLTSSTNDVDTLAADVNGILTYTDADDLTVGTVGATSGINSHNHAITLNTGDALTIAQNINAGSSHNVNLTLSAGDVTETTGAVSSANVLTVNAPGALSMAGNNNVNSLVAHSTTSGDINYHDTNGVTLTDVTTADGSITVTAGNNITVGTVTSASTGTSSVSLTSTGGSILDDSDDTTAIDANQITLNSNGDVGANTTGGFDLAFVDISLANLDAGGLTVNAPGSIYLNFIGGSLLTSLINSLSYDPQGTVVLSSGNITLDSGLFNNVALNHLYLAATNGDLDIQDDIKLVGGLTPELGLYATNNVNLASGVDTSLSVAGGNILVQADYDLNGAGAISTSVGNVSTLDTVNFAMYAATGIDTHTAGVINLSANNTTGGGVSIDNVGDVTLFDATALGSGGIFADGISNASGGDVNLTAHSSINVNAPIVSSGGDVNLTADENVAVNASVTTAGAGDAGNATITANNGSFTMDAFGLIDTTDLTSDGYVSIFADSTGVGSGNASALGEINAGGNLIDVNINSASGDTVTQLALTSLTADQLLLRGTSDYLLDNTTNSINTVAADITGSLSLTTNGALAVDTVTSPSLVVVDGITSNGGDVALTAIDALTLNKDINAGAGMVTLTGHGASEAGGVINAGGGLALIGTGLTPADFTLNGSNNVTEISADINGALVFNNGSNDLIVCDVNAIFGITTNGYDVTLTSGLLTLDDDINAGIGGTTVTLNAAGVTATLGSVIADNLLLIGTGTFDLEGLNNDVGVLAADITGDLTYTDINALEVGNVGGFGGTNGITSNGGDITVTGGSLALTQGIDASGLSTGNATLTATAGAITDGNGASDNITAQDLTLSAVDGIGSAADSIETTVSNLKASNTNNDINIDNTGALTLTNFGIGNAVTNTNGNIHITAGSPLTVDADVVGGGDIKLEAFDAGLDIDHLTVGANIQSTGIAGLITLNAGANVVQNSGTISTSGDVEITADKDGSGVGDITQNGGNITANTLALNAPGTIDVDQSGNDALTLNAHSTVSGSLTYRDATDVVLNDVTTADGPITVNAGGTIDATNVDSSAGTGDIDLTASAGDINVVTVNAGSNNATLTATTGSILDNSSLITGNLLTLSAANGIGTGTAINTTATTIDADVTSTGVINLNETDAVTLNNVKTFNGPITVNAGGTIDATNVDSSAGTGDIDLTASAGDINVVTVNAGSNNATLTATTGSILDNSSLITGNLLTLSAANGIGTGTAINTTATTIDADVTSTGVINLNETDAVTLNNVKTFNGPITVTTGGTTNVNDVESLTNDAANDINITASAGDIKIATGTGIINAGTLGDVTLEATTGSILDPSSLITGDVVNLTAANGIGDLVNPINTSANTINADVTAAGLINLHETDDVTLNNVTTFDGPITVDSIAGTLTLGTITAGGINTIDLTAFSDILDDAVQTTKVSGDTLNLTSGGVIGATGDGDIDTNVDFLNAAADGDIFLTNQSGLEIQSLTSTNGAATLLTGGSTILDGTTVHNKFTLEAINGDILFNNTVESQTDAVNIKADDGSIYATGAGPHIVAKADSLLSVPNGTIGLTSPLDVNILGNLVLDIGSKLGSTSGDLTGTVNSPTAAIPLILPSSFPSPLRPPGNVFFNGVRIWPSISTFLLSQQAAAGGILGQFNFPSVEKLALVQINTFDGLTTSKSGPIFLYHPLSELDSGSFDEEFQLDEGAYDFIDGQIHKKKKKKGEPEIVNAT